MGLVESCSVWRKMASIGMILSTIIFINFLIGDSESVKCVTTENTGGGDLCEGDYCVYAELPHFKEPVKGCLNGDLLKRDIPDQCELSAIGGRQICICSKDGCNVNSNGMKKEQMKLRKCYACEGKNCSKDTTVCWSEYCTLSRYPDGKLIRGCGDASMPLFERKGFGTCVTPAFPTHAKDRNFDESTLRSVTCSCDDGDLCNGPLLYKRLKDQSSMKSCKIRAYAKTRFGTYQTPDLPDCQGDHCFSIMIDMADVTVNVSGCMSYFLLNGKKAREHEELNEKGCMSMNSNALRFKACFDTEENLNPNSNRELKSANEDEKEKGKMDEGEDGEEGIARNHKLSKNKTPKERESRLRDEDKEEKGEPKNLQESVPIKPPEPQRQQHAIAVDEDPENPTLKEETEGNTAIVAVFVAIMILIVIAGVIWKFELHKKIFHARYQTVAGG